MYMYNIMVAPGITGSLSPPYYYSVPYPYGTVPRGTQLGGEHSRLDGVNAAPARSLWNVEGCIDWGSW